MRMLMAAIGAATLALSPAPLLAHKLIDANEAVSVAKSDLTVVPAIEWNRISRRPGSDAERWTLDGELLNDVLFFGEVKDGVPLFREVDRKNNPLPAFSETMLLIDLPDLWESSLRIVKGITVFEIERVEPAQFLGNAAVEFEYRALGADDIWRNGLAVATLIDGELFMMAYDAPAIFYYEKSLDDFRQLVSTAHLD